MEDPDEVCTLGSARVWEATTGKEIAYLTLESDVLAVAFSPDSQYVVSGGVETTRVWKAVTGTEIIRISHSAIIGEMIILARNSYMEVVEAMTVSFSPDGRYILSTSQNGTAQIWDIKTGQEVSRMIHPDKVWSAAFSTDGKFVVSGSGGSGKGTIMVWPYRPEDWIAKTCLLLTSNFTREEWKQYIGDALPYQAICPNLPIEPEITITPTP